MAKQTGNVTPHVETQALAQADEYAEFIGLGSSDIKKEDISIPRLIIVQPTHPQVTDGKAVPGELFNTLTEEKYKQDGKNAVNIIILAAWMSRTKWASDDLDAERECQSNDGEMGTKFGSCARCPFKDWGKNNEQPECTEFRNLLTMPIDEHAEVWQGSFAYYSAKKKSIGAVVRMLSAVATRRVNGMQWPIFGSIWELSSNMTKNEKGTFFLPQFRRIGDITDVPTLRKLKDRYEEFQSFQDAAKEALAAKVETDELPAVGAASAGSDAAAEELAKHGF